MKPTSPQGSQDDGPLELAGERIVRRGPIGRSDSKTTYPISNGVAFLSVAFGLIGLVIGYVFNRDQAETSPNNDPAKFARANTTTNSGDSPPTWTFSMSSLRIDAVEGGAISATRFKKGDRVEIVAQGQVSLGPNLERMVGRVSPEGIDIYGGLPDDYIAKYSLKRGAKLGALLVRMQGERKWQVIGRKGVFTPRAEGRLEFRINDKDPLDNEGGFIVELRHRTRPDRSTSG